MKDFKKQARELVAKMTTEEKISQLRQECDAVERLGIMATNWWNECLHGVARTGEATVFPQAIAMAASFDPALIGQVANAIADEARAKYNEFRVNGHLGRYQGLAMCSPNINIFRDPRWGRGHETYGEDPYLTGCMGASYINGLQGDGEFHKADATIKHYAVHSGPEKLRHGFDTEVSEEELYDTYLRAFRYCIDHAHPAAVMGAYNAVSGVPCCCSKRLLTEILREEFGFDGYVISDAGAIKDIYHAQHAASDPVEASAKALEAGCDVDLGDCYRALPEALACGRITEAQITRAAERIFEARCRLGMFDATPYDSLDFDVVGCPEHLELSRQMARESMVLLKNDGLLPLKKGAQTIAVIGPNATRHDVLLGNYNGTPLTDTTLLEGIRRAAGARVRFAEGCDPYRTVNGHDGFNGEEGALAAARASDVVILCMGLNPGMEGEEMEDGQWGDHGDKTDLELPAVQQSLICRVLALNKPTIFVNVSGSAVNLSVAQEHCNAVLQCFYPGAQGGEALAELLFGDAAPSGHLPVTFYRSAEELPPFEDYSMKNRTYRFFRGTPLYPFGYGLTYTSFTLSQAQANGTELTVRVRNTGTASGVALVQVYAMDDAPRLIGFARVCLQPGAEQPLRIFCERSAKTYYIGLSSPAGKDGILCSAES